MPIYTMLLMAWPYNCSASRFISMYWSKISEKCRLRVKPNVPVAQKAHFSAHPTCEEMQAVTRCPEGINTPST